MPRHVHEPLMTYIAGEDIATAGLRVKLNSSNQVVKSGLGGETLGYIKAPALSGEPCTVVKHGVVSLHSVVAAAAITANALVYGAAAGKVSSTAAGVPLGRAFEAATADNAEIAMVPIEPMDLNMRIYKHTVTAGEDTANTLDITTEFTSPVIVGAWVQTAAGTFRMPQGLVTNPSTSVVRVADTGFAAGEIVTVIVARGVEVI